MCVCVCVCVRVRVCVCARARACVRASVGPIGVAVDGHGRIWVSERHPTLKITEDVALTLSLTPLFLEDNIDIISDAQGDGGGAWGPRGGDGATASQGPRTRKGSVKVFSNDVLIEVHSQRVGGICLTINRGP